MDIYQKNLQAVKQTNKYLYERLSEIDENIIYEVFCDGDFANANILDNSNNSLFYQKEPIKEIEKSFKDIEKEKYLYKALYIYGIANGFLLKMLLQNREHKYFYIFEPEIELIFIALNLQDFSSEILNERVTIFYTKDFTHSLFQTFLNPETPLYFKTYDLIINNDYYLRYDNDIKNTNNHIITTYRYLVQVTGNSAEDELIGLNHFLDNIPLMLQNPTLRELEKKGANSKTAIIVATGPSLEKQLPLLKKIKDKATLFCIDASFPILEKEDIKPDIVLSLERVYDTGKFYEKVSKEFQEDIVFALSSVVHKNVLDNIKSGTLQLSMRPVGNHYKYLEIDKWGYVGLGISAANMAYELIERMDFETAIFIGQDLAYAKSGKSHAKNHIFGEDEVKQNKNDEFVTAYGGDGEVPTTKVWKMFKVGLENRIKKNNDEKSLITVNATEGGARIEGTTEMSFKEAIEKYIADNGKKDKIILNKPSETEYEENMKKIIKKLEEILKISEKFIKEGARLLKDLTMLINRYKKFPIEDIHLHIRENEIRKVLDKVAKIRENFYLSTSWNFYGSMVSPILNHLEYDIAYWSSQPENSKRRKLQKKWKIVVFHHEWLLRVLANVEKINDIVNEKLKLFENEESQSDKNKK